MKNPHAAERLGALQRRTQVAELYIRGWTQATIAEHFGVSQPTVCEDLHYIRRQWRAAAIRNFDEARDLELKKIDQVEREAWDAWERSQKPSQAAVVTDDSGKQRSTKSVKNQHGDAKYLDVVLKCVTQRCELLGIQPDQEEAVADDSGDYRFRGARILDVVAQIRQRAGDPGAGAAVLPLQPGDVRSADEPG